MRRRSTPRGNTLPGRLRLLDRWVLAAALAPPGSVVVDLGPGAMPWTTLELARALPGREVVAVERDPERAVAARVMGLRVIEGGFSEVPPCALLRAMNVLRDLRPAEAEAALAELSSKIQAGGALVEGSASHSGHVLAARLLRERGGRVGLEALVFATDFSAGFAPAMFRGPLPQGLRLPWRAGNPAFEVLERWERAWRTLPAGLPVERAFADSLAAAGAQVVGGAGVFGVVSAPTHPSSSSQRSRIHP